MKKTQPFYKYTSEAILNAADYLLYWDKASYQGTAQLIAISMVGNYRRQEF